MPFGDDVQYTTAPAVSLKQRWAVQLQLHATPNEGTRAVLDVRADSYNEAVALAKDEALGLAARLHEETFDWERRWSPIVETRSFLLNKSMVDVDMRHTGNMGIGKTKREVFRDEALGMASRLENWVARREGHCLLMAAEGERPFIDWTAEQLEEIDDRERARPIQNDYHIFNLVNGQLIYP